LPGTGAQRIRNALAAALLDPAAVMPQRVRPVRQHVNPLALPPPANTRGTETKRKKEGKKKQEKKQKTKKKNTTF
jgi:hypothetical protein